MRWNLTDTSVELLIGWKTSVTTAERDRIIAAWSGRLNRRFSIVRADSVLFESPEQRRAAQAAIALHSGVEVMQAGAEPAQPDLPAAADDTEGSTPQGQEDSAAGQRVSAGDAYTKRFPNASWRHGSYLQEAQQYAKQRQPVIVAVIADQVHADDLTLLRGVLWENAAEKNGVAGVDDDGNGYVDDINGIDTIRRADEESFYFSYAGEAAKLVAAAGNYSETALTDPKGLVRLMLIRAFYDLPNEPRCSSPYEAERSTDAALIEALEYAARMGARLVFVAGHYADQPSPLVLAAAAAFPGLIVTPEDRDADQDSGSCHQERSMLLAGGLANVIGIGAFRTGTPSEGVLSTIVFEGEGGMNSGLVAGFAAHMLSCRPGLSTSQLRDLLLGGIDRLVTTYNSWDRWTFTPERNRFLGFFNATRSLLGRSSGGSLYGGDWALISRDSLPGRYDFGLAYDYRRSRLYLYGGKNGYYAAVDEFWFWQAGRGWRQIAQDTRPGHYPGIIGERSTPLPLLYDGVGDRLLLVAADAVWSWDGAAWQAQPAAFPFTDDYYSAPPDHYAFDSRRGRIVYYDGSRWDGARLAEFDGERWQVIAPGAQAPQLTTALVYNDRLGRVTGLEARNDKVYTTALWSWDGLSWQRQKLPSLAGSGGVLLYDAEEDAYLRMGSENYAIVPSAGGFGVKVNYYNGPDIWQLHDSIWQNIGYDSQRRYAYISGTIDYYIQSNFVWASEQRKVLFFTRGYGTLMLWQYSGSMKPAWIDNLILPQGDYSGDGAADPALWHPGTGQFTLLGGGAESLGIWGDIPAPGDYDGDGKVEFAVCRSLSGEDTDDAGSLLWIFADKQILFGQFHDIPVPLDYDSDGKTDIAVFRKDTAEWLMYGQTKPVRFGNPADLPVPADYDGDGKPELATYTPLTSTWHIQGIGDFPWGEPGDSPIPADYDGDGRKEIATWNPRKALWLVRDWRDGKTLIKKTFGAKWDIPVPGDYNGDGTAELATYSPITTLWSIQGKEPVKFGSPGDVPLVRGN